ncbi:MAG: hypothetical protein CR982_07735 [Candidatus Cloacimonadota bacterium]|nr:MAG: hypothetical protein CR982_07735 [Candidatus Cloacimonadota bacterium]PIE78254.1 MAG: hypothetical protein CSA15_08805 [Candidatus Delongbacteria bacterium]
MAHAYTPGLKVTEFTDIEKTRRLPLLGEVLVKENEDVKSTDLVAKTELPGKVYPMNVAGELGLNKADELPQYILKKVGDKVKIGELVAEKKSFFGLFKSEYRSPVNGTLDQISKLSGQVVFSEDPIPVEINAYVDGKIKNVIPNEGVCVETKGVHIQGILGLGGETFGEILTIVPSPDTVVDEDMIKPEYKGKVIVGGSKITSNALMKCKEIGVNGVVVGGFDYQDIRDILGRDLGVAITGHEKIGLTLVLTEGFGEIKMAERTFNLLKRYNGSEVSMNGATQIRAGVQRPEIIIVHNNKDVDKLSKDYSKTGIQIGDSIRVIRSPYFGKLGVVKELPAKLYQVESGAWVRVMVVTIDGEDLIIPRANIEVLEK